MQTTSSCKHIVSETMNVSNTIINSPLFPQNLTLEECREAIKGCPSFREIKKDDYIIFNYDYVFHGSFPDPKKATSAKEARLFQIRR